MKANRLVWMLLLLLLGTGCKEKPTSSIAEMRAKAEKGDAAAQYELGRIYATGRDVATNDVEAMKWFRKAAEQNHAPARKGYWINVEAIRNDPKGAEALRDWYNSEYPGKEKPKWWDEMNTKLKLLTNKATAASVPSMGKP